MSQLAILIPAARRLRLPLSRDQFYLLLAAVNEILLGVDAWLAHLLNGTIRGNEWIPVLFGPAAGLVLLAAGLVALRRRNLAATLANLVFLASIVVGALGAAFHIARGGLPAGPAGARITVMLLIWAPPVLAPFAFALVGVLGMSAAWPERPVDSGRLTFWRGRQLQMPTSKTRAYFFLVSLGVLIALVSSVLDHARTGFANPWLWLPLTVGVFALLVSAGCGFVEELSREDLAVYTGAMLALILVGVVGAVLHVDTDLARGGAFVAERFLRGAPFLAPLLFANMGMLGLIALLEPEA